MNNLFEGRLVMDDRRVDLASLIIEELQVIPNNLLRLIFEKGFKIYVPTAGDKLFFTRNRLEWSGTFSFSDGRKPTETSHVSYGSKAIVIIEDGGSFIKSGHPYSVVIHEVGHAVDCVLGSIENGRSGFLHQKLPRGRPLRYAGTEMTEKFAVAFETFFLPELFKNTHYVTHNRLELFRKSPEIFKYFEQLFKSWNKSPGG